MNCLVFVGNPDYFLVFLPLSGLFLGPVFDHIYVDRVNFVWIFVPWSVVVF